MSEATHPPTPSREPDIGSWLRPRSEHSFAPGRARFRPAPGMVVDGYRLECLLGSGGMGEVWQAVDQSLARAVAIKLMLPERVGDQAREFFAREGRAGGRITHPGVVAVHRFGQVDDVAYLVQELVPGGRSFHDALNGHRDSADLPVEFYQQVARFIAASADALQAAHDAGVVHRDVKPHNILIGPDDGPKITDFGLARIDQEASISKTGHVAGTYAYMSPEQVTLKHLRVDHRTDIYSLGIVLYEAITLTRPFAGDTTQQIVQKIMFEEPRDPRLIRSRVPRDLAVIALKAMEKNPNRRYQTMVEFAADLRRFLANEPIVAKPAGVLVRVGKWARRHPTGAAMLAATVLFLAVLLGMFVQIAAAKDQAERSLKLARDEAVRATDVSDFVVEMFQFALPEVGRSLGDIKVSDLVERAERLAESWPSLASSSGAMTRAILGNIWLGIGRMEAAKRQLEAARALCEQANDGAHDNAARGWTYLHLSRLLGRTGGDRAEVESLARKSITCFDALPVESARYGIYPRAWLSVHMFHADRRQEAFDLMLDAFASAKRCIDRSANRQSVYAELDRMVEKVKDAWYTGRRETAYRTLADYCDTYRPAVGYDPLVPMGVAAVAMYFDYYQRDHLRADPLYECCARLSRERLGETHPVATMLARLAAEAVRSDANEALLANYRELAAKTGSPPDIVRGELAAALALMAGDYRQGKAAYKEALARADQVMGAGSDGAVFARLDLAMAMPPLTSVKMTREERVVELAESLQLTTAAAETCWGRDKHDALIVSWAIRVHIARLQRSFDGSDVPKWLERLVNVENERCGKHSGEVLIAMMMQTMDADEEQQRNFAGYAEVVAEDLVASPVVDMLWIESAMKGLLALARWFIQSGPPDRAVHWLDEAERMLRTAAKGKPWSLDKEFEDLARLRMSAGQWDAAVDLMAETVDSMLAKQGQRDVVAELQGAGHWLQVEVGARLLAKGDSRGRRLLEGLTNVTESLLMSSEDHLLHAVQAHLVLGKDAAARREEELAKEHADRVYGLLAGGSGLPTAPLTLLDLAAGFERSLGRVDRVAVYQKAQIEREEIRKAQLKAAEQPEKERKAAPPQQK